MGVILEVERLTKRYGSLQALKGVSFAVEEGELFGLLGPNGAGKTTLLSILSCLLDADGGQARILGHDVVHGPTRELRRHIGIVPQELALYGDLTARENLAFFGQLYGMESARLRRRVNEVLAAVGLEGRAEERVAGYSGGMKRRLNLGAALVHEPRLIFLDEPTTGVDPQSRNHIFEEVRRLNQAGITIIYTSHYMEEVQSLCRRIGIMDHGQLIAWGAVDELLRNLEGELLLTWEEPPAGLAERLAALPGVRCESSAEGRRWRLFHADATGLVWPLSQLLREAGIAPPRLQVIEPNLERVFLKLTGHDLRD